ncbi:hypothetical protein NCS52_00742200 [Fusarium sp. LHS14.1]|nr:hypothetical protein NCS52_00742200 [Fusarium sp. LHS14.1]
MGSSTRQSARSQNFTAGGSFVTPQKPVTRTLAKNAWAGQTPDSPVDLTDEPEYTPSKKRKADNSDDFDLDYFSMMQQEQPKKKKNKHEEKRRFYVLNRTRRGTHDCPEEDIEMTGSTGNIYNVHIGKRPSCTCPHYAKGNQCKHILYVMKKVLNAPFDLVYQLGLLSTELQTIFAVAPPISAPSGGQSDKRKPIEGDCPICYCELEADNPGSIVWCKAACGQNIHQECFQMWARTKGASGNVTCPMCRSDWKGDEGAVKNVRKDKGDIEEGYINVGDQLGISRVRDESSYSRWHNYHRRRRGFFY